MNARIREAQLQKIPYMLVVGDRELESETVAVRLRSQEDLGAMPTGEFEALFNQVVARRSLSLVE
jgi:threonyl-tRNA synthetase